MPPVTLLDKIYGSNSVATLKNYYSNIVEGLEVQLQIIGKTDRDWIQLDVSGNDAPVALNLFEQKIGLAPYSVDELQKFSVVQGRVISLNEKSKELQVDLGIVSPKPCDATISQIDLQAQLTDGKHVTFQELIKLFCLFNNVPVEVKLMQNVDQKASTVKAILSEGQISLFRDWVGSRLDRLIILGTKDSKVKRALKGSRVFRDIITTESLGALEHTVLCKLGTDAVGLIPKVGRYLKSSVILVPFSPKNIIKKIGNETFDD
ncbi:MAG: DUF2110 family protein [Candidatus Bathyarchaeota archaeon]|jgi:hypothetical protein